jgi:NmrA-like family
MSETKVSTELKRQQLGASSDDCKDTVLVVGAAGQFAGLVVPALAKRGVKIRAFIRKPKD